MSDEDISKDWPVNPDPEFWKKKIKVDMDVITLLSIHGNLCLALRHPENTGESRKLIVSFVKQTGQYLVYLGVYTQDQLKQVERIEAEEGSPEFGE